MQTVGVTVKHPKQQHQEEYATSLQQEPIPQGCHAIGPKTHYFETPVV